MIEVEGLINLLKKNKCEFFSGVPDSVLKHFSSSLKNNKKHVIATNEGAAVSIGIGQYLSTKKVPTPVVRDIIAKANGITMSVFGFSGGVTTTYPTTP